MLCRLAFASTLHITKGWTVGEILDGTGEGIPTPPEPTHEAFTNEMHKDGPP